ncbi:MAG: hypothetical protein WAM60_14335 [Candidatus Promineifilaceae bacterium]
MNQPQTQTPEYWGNDFNITNSDIEEIYNGILEAERPQTANQIARVIIGYRVAEEKARIKQILSGRTIYQPKNSYQVGDDLVFPTLKFAQATVTNVREGYDPQVGKFNVIAVQLNNKTREFAADFPNDHVLNIADPDTFDPFDDFDLETLYQRFETQVGRKITEALEKRPEFVRLGNQWFVKELMAEVNIGHLHLAEAVLEMNDGGPLATDEILVYLDMDEGLDASVQRFSLNYALLHDGRFDEVGPPGKVSWFLRRLEPDAVASPPELLEYEPIDYDQSLLSPQLLLLERELDDEWSDLEAATMVRPTILSLTYPHRWAGTLPLSSRTRPLFPGGISAHQRITLIDEQTEQAIQAWIVQEHRYIYGLTEWFEENQIPIGGFITLKPGPEAGVVLIDFDRRRPQREWVRLASVENNRLKFDLERRSVSCGYDDLMIVGTDYVAALEAYARRVTTNQRSLASLLTEIFPELARLNPQQTVHSKTIYSAINMVKRVSPGPLFAELIKHSSFHPVGDHYWQYEK